MSYFQRIRDILFGLFLILFAVSFILIPEEGFEIAAGVVGILLFLYGARMLWYYFRMARHMVGGRNILYRSIIILDLGLFTGSIASMNSFIIVFYLFGIFAFAGFVNVLRAFEVKRFGGAWRFKLFSGIISVLFALLMLVLGVILGDRNILVYGFAVSLIYSGVMRLVTAFKKTAIVYIQ